jgi:predicted phage terminase large subunit-like protein
MRSDSNARNEWRTTAGGIFYAVGAQGTITGYGAGKHRNEFGGAIIIDDPHKADEAKSDIRRKKVIEWFSTTLESRKNSTDTPIILIMQRLHQEDLAGWLLAGGNGEEWEHISLPALRADGTALWPEKHDVATLHRMEKSNRQVFAGQYQQRPNAEGGNIMRGEWFKLYDQPPRIKYRMMYADTAQKTAEHNDYSVFEEWGLGDDGKLYLLDMIRGKWEIPELERRAPAFWNKANARDSVVMGQLRQLKVEDNASGTGLIQRIKLESRIPIAGITRIKDKYTRLSDVIGYIESGYVCLPRNAPFLSDFLSECEAFTADDSHPHDDQIDPMVDAINDMLAGNNAAKLWENML